MKKRILIAGLCLAMLVISLVPVSCTDNQTSTTSTNTTSTPVSTSTNTTTNTTVSTTPTTSEEIAFPKIGRITVQELKQKMDADIESVIILDTRDVASYTAGHIYRALNYEYIPVGNLEDMIMKIQTLPDNKLIVVYCDCAGEETSGAMASIILDEMFMIKSDMVKALKGGISAWKSASYPLYSGATLEESQLVKP